MNDDVCPYHAGERIVPFAALFTNGDFPLSLRLYTLDSYPDDSLCFDLGTNPNVIVVCRGRDATEAVVSWDEGDVDEVDYEAFIEPIAIRSPNSLTCYGTILDSQSSYCNYETVFLLNAIVRGYFVPNSFLIECGSQSKSDQKTS